MSSCPNCGSRDVESNKIEDEIMTKVLHAGHVAHRAGIHFGALGAIAAVGAMKIINACRSVYRCNNCDCRFD